MKTYKIIFLALGLLMQTNFLFSADKEKKIFSENQKRLYILYGK